MKTLAGKRALITGAASGIGRCVTRLLAKKGTHVFLVDVNQQKLQTVCDELRDSGVDVESTTCDLSNRSEIESCVNAVCRRWGTLDILVNNAGVCFYGLTEQLPLEDWDHVLAVNLRAPIELTHRLLPMLLKRPEAHVLNVASMYGFFVTNRCAAYHVSKFGLLGFSEALRAEYGRQGLGVTAVCPGYVDTGLHASLAGRLQVRPARKAPKWVSTTADRVAEKAVRALYRDPRIVLVSPLAHVAYLARRLSPGLLDRLYRIGRRRVVHRKLVQLADQQRAAVPRGESASAKAA